MIGRSEDKLAAVLGHEAAHIVARHSAEGVTLRALVGGAGWLLCTTAGRLFADARLKALCATPPLTNPCCAMPPLVLAAFLRLRTGQLECWACCATCFLGGNLCFGPCCVRAHAPLRRRSPWSDNAVLRHHHHGLRGSALVTAEACRGAAQGPVPLPACQGATSMAAISPFEMEKLRASVTCGDVSGCASTYKTSPEHLNCSTRARMPNVRLR